MPKNIVLCCDGTGNQFGENNANLIKLYRALVRDSSQVTYYHPGVGTMGAKNALTAIGKTWTKVRGLAFGYGVSDNIADAYEFLMHTFEPGDSVYIFGFSRGSYTARALCGMLGMFGLLSQGNEGMIPYAVRLFKSGKKDRFLVAARFKKTFCIDCKPHFLGVWDTVSSVGWILDPIGWKRGALPFTKKLPDVEIIRHAVSIDERRAFFRQNLVDDDPRPGRNVREVWFPGVHSDVGGSYPELESGLSKIAFQWMLRAAIDAHLAVNIDQLARELGEDPRYARPLTIAVKHNSLFENLVAPLWWLAEFWPKSTAIRTSPAGQTPEEFEHVPRFNLFRRRTVPEGACIHESALKRKHLVPDYNPKNLPQNYQIEHEPAVVQWPFVSCDPIHLDTGGELTVCIDARPKWNVTPLQVMSGEKYRFKASGTWHDASIASGPEGYESSRLFFRLTERFRRMPKARWFALICVIGHDMSTAFLACKAPGDQQEVIMSADGFLNCFANDLPLFYFNNSGSVRLSVNRLS
jgi:Uncharacterized alpha/beta hydrolase domain (DUF2235)